MDGCVGNGQFASREGGARQEEGLLVDLDRVEKICPLGRRARKSGHFLLPRLLLAAFRPELRRIAKRLPG